MHNVKAKHPNELIFVVAHSNGGNVATGAAAKGAPIDAVARLGSPTPDPQKYPLFTWQVPASTLVFNLYDPDDPVIFRGARPFGGLAPDTYF